MNPAPETYTRGHYTSKFDLAVVVLCAMTGVIMQTLDTTIANVALPHMQGNLSASRDQITWVLTSYIVAAAIMTAPVGWIATRFGKKNILIAAMVGFTVASVMCGMALNLSQIVVFRLLQGTCGAALAPLSQAVMLDLYPPEKRGQAMAIFGTGIMLGPIMGPTIGGFLTENYSWRWVFYVNVPFGIIASIGLWFFFKDTKRDESLKFDWLGFAVLALGVGALQLMLDRGTDKDWFSSNEIIIECTLAALGLYLFGVHMLTTRNPLLPRKVFADRNYVLGLVLMYVVAGVLLASLALMPPYLQNLSGYPVLETGLLLGPRGFGSIVAMFVVGTLSNRVDPRHMMTVGGVVMCWSLWEMSRWTPSIGVVPFLVTTIAQGFGVGMVFTPLNLVAFATLPGALRANGTSLLNLVRNVGSAVGISVTTVLLSNSMQAIHSQLSGYASPFNRALGQNAVSLFMNPQLPTGAMALDGAIRIRAAIEGYANDFLFMFYVSLIVFPIIWMLHRPAYSRSALRKPEIVEAAE